MTENATKWGQRKNNPNAHWVKMRDLVGTTFTLVRVNEGDVSGRASYIFECEDGALFSANKTQSGVSSQIARDGLPPTGHPYTVAAVDSEKSPTGDSLILVAL